MCCESYYELSQIRNRHEEVRSANNKDTIDPIIESEQEALLNKKKELKALELEIDAKEVEMANLRTRSLKLGHDIHNLEEAKLKRAELEMRNQARYEIVTYFLESKSKIFSGDCPLQFVRDTVFEYFPKLRYGLTNQSEDDSTLTKDMIDSMTFHVLRDLFRFIYNHGIADNDIFCNLHPDQRTSFFALSMPGVVELSAQKLKNILFHGEGDKNVDPKHIESIKSQLVDCPQEMLMAIHQVAQEYLDSSKKNKKPRLNY